MTKKLSWTPKRKGKIYCAPACGRGCTYEEYLSAKANATRLRLRMKGVGWRTRVWENLGWHYCVTNGYANVHPIGDNKFYCLLSNVKGGHGGASLWQVNNNRADPNKSVQIQLDAAKRFVFRINTVLSEVKRLLND